MHIYTKVLRKTKKNHKNIALTSLDISSISERNSRCWSIRFSISLIKASSFTSEVQLKRMPKILDKKTL